MKNVIINNKPYILVENYKEGFDIDKIQEKLTDYFDSFDYILGDWAYGKLRLKGFCKKENPKYNDINKFENKESYIKDHCAYDCKYFVIENVDCVYEK